MIQTFFIKTLRTQLYVRIGILLTCISPYLTASFHFWDGSIKTSLIPPLFVEVRVPNQERVWSYVRGNVPGQEREWSHVKGIEFASISTIFRLDFGIVVFPVILPLLNEGAKSTFWRKNIPQGHFRFIRCRQFR
jgi:hypothetical protein